MNQIRKRLQKFQVQIRRTDRERIISNYRNNLMNAIAFEELFEKFKAERPHEVSHDFLACLNSLSKEAIQAILSFFQLSQIAFSQKKEIWPEEWFFDCMSKNNLKLATFLQEIQSQSPFIKKFYIATIEAHQRYKIASNRYELQVRNSKCLIRSQKTQLNLSPEQNLLQAIYSNSNQETFLATLKFWAIYISKEYNFAPYDYVIMLKTFMLWYEHTNISKHQETYIFLNEIMLFFKQSKIFQTKHNIFMQLEQESLLLIDKLKRTIASAHVSLAFKQIGQVTIFLIIFSQYLPEILSELLFRPDTLINFVKKMFSCGMEMANIQQIKVGIRLVYYLLNAGLLNFCQQDDRNIIFSKIFKQYYFHQQLQFYTVYTLSALTQFDTNDKMQPFFEELPFERLYHIQNLTQKNEELIYRFSLIVLQNYRQNYILCDKILKECDLVGRLKDFIERYEKDQQLFLWLIKIVDSSIAYFVDNFIQYVEQIREYADELTFEGKNEFLKESQKYIELKFKQAQI